MATVHFGRLSGPAGFSRTVAIKRLHPNLAKDPEFVAMFLDEARVAARIRHPNVVPTLDVVAIEGEIFLVMDYVQGESLGKLRLAMHATGKSTDPRIVAAVMGGVLHGLHAAHEAKSEQGQSLNIVHRDVSPQNVLVGVDGVARVFDFGVAKAIGRVQTTREGQIKGKIAYMPPEQLQGGGVTRQVDIYAAAVVTWETLTGQRLFSGDHEGALVTSILSNSVKPPSKVAPHVPPAFDRVVMRGLERDPARRYATAREMALDLERCVGIASPSQVGEWVESLARDELAKRAALMARIEGVTPTQPSERRLPVNGGVITPTSETTGATVPSRPKFSSTQSDGSHIVVASTHPSNRRSAGRVAVVAAVIAGGLAASLLVVLMAGRNAKAPTATVPLATSTSHGEPSDPAPLPALTTSGAASLDLPVPTNARSLAHTGEQGEASTKPAPLQAHPPSKPTKRDCDPPFTIDEKGHKHYKAACL
jgi:serine/threonine-protein kinase